MCTMAHAQDYKQTDYGIKASIATKSTDVEIQWFSPQTVRVLKTPINATIDKKSLSVIASPQKNSATVKQDGNTIIMESKKTRKRRPQEWGGFILHKRRLSATQRDREQQSIHALQ